MEYKQNLVGFLDVLGFSAICQQSETSSDERQRLQSIFDLCEAIPQEFEKIPSKSKIKTVVVSDSIVMTLEQEGNNITFREIANFLLAAGKFQFHLGKNGFWIRGAISHGGLYFDSNKKQIVGPALVRTIELEKKTAKFPRIIVDPLVMQRSGLTSANEFRKEVNDVYAEHHQRALFEWQHHFDQLTERKLPQDVPFFVDFLRSVMGEEPLTTVAESIARGLRGPIEHYEKYRWLADYVLATNRQMSMGLNLHDQVLNALLG